MQRRWTMAVADLVQDHGSAPFRFQVRGESMLPTLRPGDQVLVEPTPFEALRPGDLILVHPEGQPILHRYLASRMQSGQRFLLTAGDGRWRTDPPCPEEALRGRVVAAFRRGQAIPVPAGRWPVWRHRLRAALWGAGHRLRSWLPVLLALSFVLAWGGTSRAAVTLVSFVAALDGNDIRVTWTTASEVDSLGFYVRSSDREDGQYNRVSDLIPASGDIAGGSYSWRDLGAAANTNLYYKLEGLSADGSVSFWGPVSAGGGQPTNTATSTITATPSSTPTATATPTASPTLTPTASRTPTPSPTVPPTRTPTLTPRASRTPAPRQSPAARHAAPSPTQLATATPAAVVPPTSLPAILDTARPTDTTTPPPTPEPTATSTPAPSPTVEAPPSPTVVAMSVAPSGGSAPQTEAPPPSEEELASARHRLTWVLVGIGGMIAGGLLLALLALIAFALYRWGYLRPG